MSGTSVKASDDWIARVLQVHIAPDSVAEDRSEVPSGETSSEIPYNDFSQKVTSETSSKIPYDDRDEDLPYAEDSPYDADGRTKSSYATDGEASGAALEDDAAPPAGAPEAVNDYGMDLPKSATDTSTEGAQAPSVIKLSKAQRKTTFALQAMVYKINEALTARKETMAELTAEDEKFRLAASELRNLFCRAKIAPGVTDPRAFNGLIMNLELSAKLGAASGYGKENIDHPEVADKAIGEKIDSAHTAFDTAYEEFNRLKAILDDEKTSLLRDIQAIPDTGIPYIDAQKQVLADAVTNERVVAAGRFHALTQMEDVPDKLPLDQDRAKELFQAAREHFIKAGIGPREVADYKQHLEAEVDSLNRAGLEAMLSFADMRSDDLRKFYAKSAKEEKELTEWFSDLMKRAAARLADMPDDPVAVPAPEQNVENLLSPEDKLEKDVLELVADSAKVFGPKDPVAEGVLVNIQKEMVGFANDFKRLSDQQEKDWAEIRSELHEILPALPLASRDARVVVLAQARKDNDARRPNRRLSDEQIEEEVDKILSPSANLIQTMMVNFLPVARGSGSPDDTMLEPDLLDGLHESVRQSLPAGIEATAKKTLYLLRQNLLPGSMATAEWHALVEARQYVEGRQFSSIVRESKIEKLVQELKGLPPLDEKAEKNRDILSAVLDSRDLTRFDVSKVVIP